MRYKILLVDDDVALLRFISEYLRGQSFDVVSANSGSDALRLAYREHPDLVVMDVMMPGMDGWEVTGRLREMADLPIILLTAKSSETDKLRGFSLGVDDYITKPFSFAELTARIQAVLNRAQKSGQGGRNLILFGDTTLDLDKRQATRGNTALPLTPTEFRLLEALATRNGHAVSEIDLIHEVWGGERRQETAAVRRYIWLLRQKIEPDPAHPQYVLTVRGYGYRLEFSSPRRKSGRPE
jgi:two-component system KDP operon response regulator KdpE